MLSAVDMTNGRPHSGQLVTCEAAATLKRIRQGRQQTPSVVGLLSRWRSISGRSEDVHPDPPGVSVPQPQANAGRGWRWLTLMVRA
jgi:hypothetical protein